jgi:predicted SAM-dependent methyltransferase
MVELALEIDSDYLFFLGDDVIPPGNTISMLWSRQVDIATGIYWTKGSPTLPYIWRDYQRGPFLDWKAGEFFPVNLAGCDCLLVNMDVFKAIEPPWFSRDWLFSDEQDEPVSIATEDYYFYAKTKEAGFKLWADTSVQCWHEDRGTGMAWGLTNDMIQAVRGRDMSDYKGKLIADLGSGPKTRGEIDGIITRYDLDESTNPDIRCDVRKIPEPDEKFDVVFSNNVLEHFDYEEVPEVLKEWIRILKVGGELRIEVPNFEHGIRNILDGKDAAQDWWIVYGKPEHYKEYNHKMGFTQPMLEKLFKSMGCLKGIHVEHDPTGYTINLIAKATKYKHQKARNLQPILDDKYDEKVASGVDVGQMMMSEQRGGVVDPDYDVTDRFVTAEPKSKKRGNSKKPRPKKKVKGR